METENKIFPFGKQLLLSLSILREVSELPLWNLMMGVKRRFSTWRKRHAVWGGRVLAERECTELFHSPVVSPAGLQAFLIKLRQCGNHQESWKGLLRGGGAGAGEKPCVWVSICGWTRGRLLLEREEKAGIYFLNRAEENWAQLLFICGPLVTADGVIFFLMEKTTYHKRSQTVSNLPWRRVGFVYCGNWMLCVCHKEEISFVDCVTSPFF